MSDTLRIKSHLPVAIHIAEPHPDPEHPGNSPVLRQAVIRPGVNEGVDADLFRKWAEVHGGQFVASADDVKAGNVAGRMHEMTEDEPETEYGFEVALRRTMDAIGGDAGQGSTLTDKGPIDAKDMRPGDPNAVPAAPVLAAAAPLKVPATTDRGTASVADKKSDSK